MWLGIGCGKCTGSFIRDLEATKTRDGLASHELIWLETTREDLPRLCGGWISSRHQKVS